MIKRLEVKCKSGEWIQRILSDESLMVTTPIKSEEYAVLEIDDYGLQVSIMTPGHGNQMNFKYQSLNI